MAHRVYAPVDHAKRAPPNSAVDASWGQAARDQLLPADHPALPVRNPRNGLVQELTPGIIAPAPAPEPSRGEIGTLPPHNRGERTHPPMPAVLRPRLLETVGITLTGTCAPEIHDRINDLGASQGTDVLVHGASPPTSADETRAALDHAWDAIRAHKLPPSPGLIVLLSPPPSNAHAHAARAGLENLARTLSTEWARHDTRTVTVHQNAQPHEAAELVAFLASKAGAYYAGCAFTLR